MKIVTVIPTFNRKELLRGVIKQLFEQELKNVSLEIVVVIDGSTDGTIEMIQQEFPLVKTVEGTGDWWYTKSMNEGFQYAHNLSPDYILTLNDDLIFDTTYVQTLIDDLLGTDKNGIMGSISLTFEEPHKIFFSGVKETNFNTYKSVGYHKAFTYTDISKLSGVYPSTQLPGRGMLIPISILTKLNYFDEGFIQYGSDTEFCYRAKKNGFNVYVSWNAKIFSHWKETGIGSPFIKQSFFSYSKNVFFNKKSSRYLGNNIRMLKKHFNRFLFPVLLSKVILAKFSVYFKYKCSKSI